MASGNARAEAASNPPEELPLEVRRALARREGPALERFFDAYFARLYAFARRMVRDAHTAEDVTQEILLRVHRGLGSYQPERPLRPWVFTIAANVVRDHMRSRAWSSERDRVSLDDDLDAEPVDATPPSGALETAESSASVGDAVGALPDGVRRVFHLRHFEGLAFADIASMLELTEPAARQRFSRAVRILRERLAPGRRDVEPTR